MFFHMLFCNRPKLFSEEQDYQDSTEEKESINNDTEQLFDQDLNEDEDFEIPAFLAIWSISSDLFMCVLVEVMMVVAV